MGCDEMVKRIPCRVISSNPLGKTADPLCHPRSLNEKLDSIDDFVAEDIYARHDRNSVSYTGRLNIARVSVDDGLTGHILDCYV
jgi:hypothetical protein